MADNLLKMKGSGGPNGGLAYSVVIPVFNEQYSLGLLFCELLNVLTPLKVPYEIIFVNDCSDDQSGMTLDRFSREFPEAVKLVNLTQRSGQTEALRAGLQESCGKTIFTLDADLQNDPADIPKLIKELNKGFDCVCGWRKSRYDTKLKTLLSKLGNIMQRAITGLQIHDVSCTLRAYKRECLSSVPLNWPGQHRFIPLSLSLSGYKISEIESNHRKRRFGASKYSHKRIFKVIMDFFRILSERGKQ
ncbi:MAG: glycosyltransferase family 2 protein [Candidatus Omnitrophica bacterium]|nr:glycosyltransferase family 2 protein [Candidatus Omnitrophota bacterium]